MTKILIINTPGLENRGSMAIVMGIIKCLQESMPDAKLTFLCHHYKSDIENYEKIIKNSDIKVIEHPWYRDSNLNLLTVAHLGIRAVCFLLYCVFCGLVQKIHLPFYTIYDKYDLIVDLNSDSLNDHYTKSSSFFVLFNIFCAILSKKPIAVCATGIGPFKNRILNSLTRIILNKVDLITVRENNSLEYLRQLDINKPKIHLTADLAFLMDPVLNGRLDEILRNEGITISDRLVGITVPSKITHSTQYFIADVTNLIVEKFDATVFLIPHAPLEEILLHDMYHLVDKKENVKIIKLLMADELKGIFNICDIVISIKFHPLIASVSAATPSLGIVTYGHYKFYGTFDKMMGLGEYLIDANPPRNTLLTEIESKVEYIWREKDDVSKEFQQKAQYMKERALLNGRLIRELIRARGLVDIPTLWNYDMRK